MTGTHPVVIYLHDGAYYSGKALSPASHYICHKIIRETGAIVINVDYALAPNSKLPDAAQEVIEVIDWVRQGSLGKKADSNNIILFGVEAGGSIATVAAMNSQGVEKTILAYPTFAGVSDSNNIRKRFPLTPLYNASSLNEGEMQTYDRLGAYEGGWISPFLATREERALMGQVSLFTCGVSVTTEENYLFTKLMKEEGAAFHNKHVSDCYEGFLRVPVVQPYPLKEFWEWFVDELTN